MELRTEEKKFISPRSKCSVVITERVVEIPERLLPGYDGVGKQQDKHYKHFTVHNPIIKQFSLSLTVWTGH